MEQIFSSYSASISELKKNPSALISDSNGLPIAVLNHNKPTAYLIPAETYEKMLDKIDDLELLKTAKKKIKIKIKTH
jgi:antitoxin StbD